VTPTAALQTAWAQQGIWSAVAGRLKHEIAQARTVFLGLLVATAILETAAAQLVGALGDDAAVPRAVAASGAVLAALAAALQARSRGGERIRQWTRARSASEALKEQVYRYATGTGRYEADPDAALSGERERILAGVADLERYAATVPDPRREPPPPMDLAAYVEARVEGQIDGYYLPQAASLARRGAAWRRVQSLLLLVGAGLGALVAFAPHHGLGAWVAVLTTVAGAFGAHVEASRFDHLAVSYRTTASRLQSLRDEWKDTLSKRTLAPGEKAGFVDRCENAISVENEAWMAGWTQDD
jgi:hypothetical protein